MFIKRPDHLNPWIKKEFIGEKFFAFQPDPNEGDYYFKEIELEDGFLGGREIYRTYVDEGPKILINYHLDFFHTVVDILGTILMEFKREPETLFLIHINDFESNFFRHTYNSFIFNTLNKMNVRYEVLFMKPNQVIHVKDIFVYQRYLPSVYECFLAIEESAQDLYLNQKPDKKVYVSRKKVLRSKSEEFLFRNVDRNTLMYQDDNRLDEPELMDEFFRKMGFQIVYPEDFKIFEDQVRFFSTVKTLAGVTGSGLLNSIFMPRGGLVLEMSTPLLGNGREDLHPFYREISFCKEHTYISMTNSRNSKHMIDKIDSNKALMRLLSD